MRPIARKAKRGGEPSQPQLPKPQIVFISHLVRDPAVQVREGLEPSFIKRYENVVAAGQQMPPVRVVSVAGVLYLVDGFHRVAAHERREVEEILAIVTDGSLEEARWEAAMANMRHGLPLKPREVQRVFSVYIAARRHRDGKRYKSYREIAAELGGAVAHTTIRHWMKRYHPKIYKAMQAGYDDPPESDADWPAPNPYEHAIAAWRSNTNSAFAALSGVPEEQREELLNELQDRVYRELPALRRAPFTNYGGDDFSF